MTCTIAGPAVQANKQLFSIHYYTINLVRQIIIVFSVIAIYNKYCATVYGWCHLVQIAATITLESSILGQIHKISIHRKHFIHNTCLITYMQNNSNKHTHEQTIL